MGSARGVLLINLGTPDAPRPAEVRRYLREFLMDPFVVDLAFPMRWLLVHGIILRSRPRRSAEAYAKIWTERGSPLLFHTRELTERVQELLGPGVPVKFSMRYGNPSIESSVREFHRQGVREIVALPLYPQYSLAATESSIVELKRAIDSVDPSLSVEIIEDFFAHEGFLRAFAQVARESLEGFDYDHLLFSFHGLPERQVRKADPTGVHCLASSECCERIGEANRRCYRAQCFQTAYGLAALLGIDSSRYTVCFQSRLGRSSWIKPYTDAIYAELPKRGIKKLAVICPAFVADCLETLEEIQIRGREQFRALGGEELVLVPSLNSRPAWAECVAGMISSERT